MTHVTRNGRTASPRRPGRCDPAASGAAKQRTCPHVSARLTDASHSAMTYVMRTKKGKNELPKTPVLTEKTQFKYQI